MHQSKYLVLALAVAVGACSTPPLPRAVVVRDVPQPDVIHPPGRPVIAPDLPDAEKVRLIAQYIQELEARLTQALEALNVYRTPTKDNTK